MIGELGQMNDPYKYLWREETSADYPMHTYITKGTDLHGFVRKGTTEVQWFARPFKSWSPSRRKFRKLNKKEIDAIVLSSNGIHSPFVTLKKSEQPINVLDFAMVA